MSQREGTRRRDLLPGALGAAILAGSAFAGRAVRAEPERPDAPDAPDAPEPFWGEHQAGIVTFPIQHHLYFAAFDLLTDKRDDVVRLLQAWTAASARMAKGATAQPLGSGLTLAVPPARAEAAGDAAAPGQDSTPDYGGPDYGGMVSDTGEAIGMAPSRLTVTFGFGPSLFVKDGKDRYGLAARRPASLVDMPRFENDRMIEARTGGDLCVQSCAEDPQVAFHAVRQLARIAEGTARLRWVQVGYRTSSGERHLLGFANGVGNPPMDDPVAMNKVVWVREEGPDWMRGGTYLVARRIRFALEHWDHMPANYQESALGEDKFREGPRDAATIAALGHDKSTDGGDAPSHLRIAVPRSLTMLRRSFSFNEGLSFTVERWPPWRQGIEYDAGMFFIAFQHDPRSAFIAMYDKMSKADTRLNQIWTHEGGGLFACPPGAAEGGFVGQTLFDVS